jgi:hypothetical protein
MVARIQKVGSTFEGLDEEAAAPHGRDEGKRDGSLADSTRCSGDQKAFHAYATKA